MRADNPPVVRRADYAPPTHFIRHAELTFDLDPAKTLVTSRLTVERNPAGPGGPLRLHGEDLTLTRCLLDGQPVAFRQDDGCLAIDAPADGTFTLEIRNTCAPEKNTQLSGLYTSGGGLFTQCEAEGFRRITYFLDRPDVMASYAVTLRASKAAYPVLLSNGNLVGQGELDGGRHYAKWQDPFPKPSYLFALVAADLVAREQHVRSRSGKDHLLQVWVRPGDLDKTEHAMRSLVASVVWDEARFGLPLDLDRFMIVAVADFNMGAMENKGLNLFNTKYVLASPATATDDDYADIESVVGHEYFHNWTGNRVTCRDWFQLSLKEGLTVFRDQEFSMDMLETPSARAVKRIEDVRRLRQMQFPEDAGPMAHPVRPEAYVAMDNFYTPTVYEKGAEVVRMMQTLVGRAGFERGMTLYFQRHDGQAVTCDDFAQAIADANPGSDLATRLDAFKRWYAQAGTPRVVARGRYDAPSRTYTLGLEQHPSPSVADAGVQQPFVIPFAMGLVGRDDGRSLPLRLEDEPEQPARPASRVLVLDAPRAFYTFTGIDQPPVLSGLRGFSAPVMLQDGLGDDELLTLLAHDADPYNRWEAGQRLAMTRLLARAAGEVDPARAAGEVDPARAAGDADPARAAGEVDPAPALDGAFVQAMRDVLEHPGFDPAFKAQVLMLPSEGWIAEQMHEVDPPRIHAAREAMKSQLATALVDEWEQAFDAHVVAGGYAPDAVSSGRRALANLALQMRCIAAVERGDTVWPGRAYQRVKAAGNMTDRLGALLALLGSGAELAEAALERFYAASANEPLALDKWFAVQAQAPERGGRVLERVIALLAHPDYAITNPNRVRSVVGTFCQGNPGAFHRADGAGYAFWADRVRELDRVNPQLASRIARALDRWRQLAEPYRSRAQAAIARVAAEPALSVDTREILDHALAVRA